MTCDGCGTSVPHYDTGWIQIAKAGMPKVLDVCQACLKRMLADCKIPAK
jgi:hypothetical protein